MVDIEHLQFGLETFGDIVANEDGSLQTAAASIRQIVREGSWPTTWALMFLVLVSIIDQIIVCQARKRFWRLFRRSPNRLNLQQP